VRILSKKLRYALEIGRDAGVAGTGPLLRVLKRHQVRLGDLHDLQVLLKRVRGTETSPVLGASLNDLTAYADSLDEECRRLHAGFVEHRGELAMVAKDVRQQIVPALTTTPRRQARVVRAIRPAAGSRAR
jgi:CHAD domain-containing protein